MDTAIYFLYQFMECASFLLLSAIGMAIIFGMMNITNLATGEMIMIGSYSTAVIYHALNLPLPVCVVAATLITGVFGLILDRLILSRLYDRPLESVVATWGISLVIKQTILLIFGVSQEGISIPFSSIKIGSYSYPVYRFLLIGMSILVIAGVYALFKFTKFGLHARATMQNREIARSLGINANVMNASTFMLGSALSGLCGALYAPVMSLAPSMGSNFLTQSFVTVLVGGSNPLLGTLTASGGLGVVQSVFTVLFGSFWGQIGLLIAAIFSVRFMPNGFTSVISGISEMRRKKKLKKKGDGEK